MPLLPDGHLQVRQQLLVQPQHPGEQRRAQRSRDRGGLKAEGGQATARGRGGLRTEGGQAPVRARAAPPPGPGSVGRDEGVQHGEARGCGDRRTCESLLACGGLSGRSSSALCPEALGRRRRQGGAAAEAVWPGGPRESDRHGGSAHHGQRERVRGQELGRCLPPGGRPEARAGPDHVERLGQAGALAAKAGDPAEEATARVGAAAASSGVLPTAGRPRS
mmetsp:Transcript_23281/g.55724  ORF Transcript_23281/g.55724 Transcript_23281/m.55724 type:complete len:220 (-) Transcript_23281:839-1498(-)